ncbi:hypothetical protein EC540_01015 [Helicobacter pylori]|nr:hypothetical protein EC540_01015 [Helicobacter pylori]
MFRNNTKTFFFFFFLKGQKRLINIKIALIYTILTKACTMVLLKDTLVQDLRTKSILFQSNKRRKHEEKISVINLRFAFSFRFKR